MLAGEWRRDRRGSPSHIITRLVHGYVSFRNEDLGRRLLQLSPCTGLALPLVVDQRD